MADEFPPPGDDSRDLDEIAEEWWEALLRRHSEEDEVSLEDLCIGLELKTGAAVTTKSKKVEMSADALAVLSLYLKGATKKRKGPKRDLLSEERVYSVRALFFAEKDRGASSTAAITLIADRLGMSEETVKHRVYKAKPRYAPGTPYLKDNSS